MQETCGFKGLLYFLVAEWPLRRTAGPGSDLPLTCVVARAVDLASRARVLVFDEGRAGRLRAAEAMPALG
jgi:chaperone required for assembly of F1-ATPase